MPDILVLCDSTEGHTQGIAERIAREIVRLDRSCDLCHLRRHHQRVELTDYNAIVIGASIHMGKHSKRLIKFVSKHRDVLNELPTALLSVSLSAAGSPEERKEANRYIAEVLEQTGWQPRLAKCVAGALRYRDYGLLKRWIMKRIAAGAGKDTDTSRNHIYTDWDAVDAFVREFLRVAS